MTWPTLLIGPSTTAPGSRTTSVAIRVLQYRARHGLSQTAFGRLVGMRQPHVARLEAADHEPSLATLVKLSTALGVDFTVDINASGVKLRNTD